MPHAESAQAHAFDHARGPAGRTAVCLHLRGLLGHLDVREQQQLVKEAWTWLAYEVPVR